MNCVFCGDELSEILPGVFICTNGKCSGQDNYLKQFDDLKDVTRNAANAEQKHTKACYQCD